MARPEGSARNEQLAPHRLWLGVTSISLSLALTLSRTRDKLCWAPQAVVHGTGEGWIWSGMILCLEHNASMCSLSFWISFWMFLHARQW